MRSSVSCPASRRRCSGSGRSARVDRTSRRLPVPRLSASARDRNAGVPISSCTSSSTSAVVPESASQAVSNPVTKRRSKVGGAFIVASALKGGTSSAACSAVSTCPQRCAGSAVLRLHRQPRGPPGTTGRPGREHQRLARAGGCRDGHRAAADTGLDDTLQAGPRHEARGDERDAGTRLVHPGHAPGRATGCRTVRLCLGHVHLPSGRAQWRVSACRAQSFCRPPSLRRPPAPR